MRVILDVESLRCTAGSSDKSYTLVAVMVEENGTEKEVGLIKVHGPNKAPQQCTVSEYSEADWQRTLTSKLKRYNRVGPRMRFDWEGSLSDWTNNGGLFLRQCIHEHGQWHSIGSSEFDRKLEDAANFAVAGIPDSHDEEAENLFRTQKQREKAQREKEEAMQLENWGCF